MSRCSSYALQCDGLYFFFFLCSLAYYPLSLTLLLVPVYPTVSQSRSPANISSVHNFCRTCCNFLQASASVGQLEHLFPASYGTCYPVCRFFFLFSPLITQVWVSPPPPTLGVLTPVSALDLLWQLSFLHLSSFPNKVNPDSHSAMYYCCHVLSASSFFSFFLSLAPQSLILITYSMRHKLAGSDADRGSSAPLRLDGGSCCLSASLSGCDKETVIDAFPRLLDGSAEFPHALIMTHDGNPCHRAMIGNEDGWCLR